VAQTLNIRVVVIVSAGAKDEEVAAPGTFAHPLEGSIKVFAAAHQREAALGVRLCVPGTPGAKVLIVRAVCKRRRQP
jgi:hypothetical protein